MNIKSKGKVKHKYYKKETNPLKKFLHVKYK